MSDADGKDALFPNLPAVKRMRSTRQRQLNSFSVFDVRSKRRVDHLHRRTPIFVTALRRSVVRDGSNQIACWQSVIRDKLRDVRYGFWLTDPCARDGNPWSGR